MDNNLLASSIGRFFRYGLFFSSGKEIESDSQSDRVSLADKYNNDSDFHTSVDIFLSQLGLEVCAILQEGILFVTTDCSADDNIFRTTMSDFRRQGEKNTHIMTAILAAILCAVYRAGEDLHSSEKISYLTERDARRVLLKTANELADEDDGEAMDARLRPAWRDILAMEESNVSSRTTPSSVEGCITLVLQSLQSQKLLKQAPKEAEGEYIITRRFAAQVKDIFEGGRLNKLLDELRLSNV
jgi:hypothetical protein